MCKLTIGLALSMFATMGIGGAKGQVYPSRPITMMLPFAAGGPTDTLARILAERMKVSLGQPVIIENVTGAAGAIALNRFARAAPDGYTIIAGPWNAFVVTGAVTPLQFDLKNDLEPVALLANNHSVIVSKNEVPAKDLKELVVWVKANQEKISAGTSGVGAGTHVGGILFQNMIGVRFQFVPYRGAGPAMQDLVAGQIDLMFDQVSNSLPQIRGGKIKPFAVMAATRSEALPDIPSVDEAGLPGLHMPIWHGMWLPKGTPQDIIKKVNQAVVESLADKSIQQRLAQLGQETAPPQLQVPMHFGAYHKSEIDKWWPVIKAANIKTE